MIKPIVKKKSPSNSIHDCPKEKSPVKSSSTKHTDKLSTATSPQITLVPNKEKEIGNLLESNPPKLKKSPVIESIDEPCSIIPVSTPSIIPNNKNKVKPPKKSKKSITQNRPAYYYVSMKVIFLYHIL